MGNLDELKWEGRDGSNLLSSRWKKKRETGEERVTTCT